MKNKKLIKRQINFAAEKILEGIGSEKDLISIASKQAPINFEHLESFRYICVGIHK